jgi:hypothetical protein
MKLKTLLYIINNLKANSEINRGIKEDEIVFITEYIASTIKDHEIELLNKIDPESDVDIDVISWALFDSDSNRNHIFNNLNDKTFAHKSVDVIDHIDEIIREKTEKKLDSVSIEIVPFKFYGYVSQYIENRGSNNKQLDYAKRFLKTLSWRYESYTDLTNNQINYLKQLIKEYPNLFNNDFLIEKGFSNACKIISELSNES